MMKEDITCKRITGYIVYVVLSKGVRGSKQWRVRDGPLFYVQDVRYAVVPWMARNGDVRMTGQKNAPAFSALPPVAIGSIPVATLVHPCTSSMVVVFRERQRAAIKFQRVDKKIQSAPFQYRF